MSPRSSQLLAGVLHLSSRTSGFRFPPRSFVTSSSRNISHSRDNAGQNPTPSSSSVLTSSICREIITKHERPSVNADDELKTQGIMDLKIDIMELKTNIHKLRTTIHEMNTNINQLKHDVNELRQLKWKLAMLDSDVRAEFQMMRTHTQDLRALLLDFKGGLRDFHTDLHDVRMQRVNQPRFPWSLFR